MRGASSNTRNLIYLRDLVRELVLRDFKVRYKRSVAGIAWSLINPLLQLLVLNLVFSTLLPLNIPNYAIYLFCGLLVWNWFQSGWYQATAAIVDQRELIKRPGFPIQILPVINIAVNFIQFCLALPILFLFILLAQLPLNASLLALPVLYLLQFLLILSLSYLSAALQVPFRDTQYLLGIGLFLGFYLSPVFYDPSIIPEALRWLYYLNPMAVLIQANRSILLDGTLPPVWPLLGIGLFSSLLLIGTYRFFMHASYRFAEEL